MQNADLIYIRDLKIETFIGTFAWEQKVKQIVSIDIDVTKDLKKAAVSKDIHDTVNYAKLAEAIAQHVSKKSFLLLETLAEEVADLILKTFAVSAVRLRVGKPGALSQAKEVGIVITRHAV